MQWCAERDSNPRPTVCKTAERVGRVRRGGKLLLFWPAAGLVGEDWWGEGSRAERNGLVVSHAVFGEVGDEDEAVGYREGDGDAISELPEDVAGIVPCETGPTGSRFANGRGIDKNCQCSNGGGRRILCRLRT